MALSIANRGTFTHNAASTSFTCSPSSNFTAGSTAAIFISADNSAAAGSSNNITGVTDSLGSTWTLVTNTNVVFDNGAASAGVQGSWFVTEMNAGTLTTNTSVTVSLGASTTAKTGSFTEVTPGASKVARVITGGAKAAGATGTAATSGATGTINVGQVVLAGVCIEAGTTQTCTGDSDVTNGSWSTLQYAEIGSTTSGNCSATQGKVQTTANSTQTYDVTLGISSDYHAAWVVFSELSVYTPLTASGGSYTVTGTAAAPKVSRLVAASAGSYALTGTDAAPKAARLVTASAGSHVATGTDATLTYNQSTGYTITADAGSLALTGTAASLLETHAISASAGSVTVTGTTATPTASRTLAASAGSVALTGTSATLSRVIVMFASGGAVAITGTAATFSRSLAVGATTSTIALTGTTTSLLLSRLLSASSGAYANTGADATLTYTPAGQNSLTCAAGSVAIDGVSAELTATARSDPRPRRHARTFASGYTRVSTFSRPRRIRR